MSMKNINILEVGMEKIQNNVPNNDESISNICVCGFASFG